MTPANRSKDTIRQSRSREQTLRRDGQERVLRPQGQARVRGACHRPTLAEGGGRRSRRRHREVGDARLARPGFGVSDVWNRDWAFHFGMSKPTIAAINGPAAGVGLVLASYCDIRMAVRGAKLTTAHGKLNLPAELGLSWLLPRLIGGARAMEWLLSSRVGLTDEAHAVGFVAELVADAHSVLEGAPG